MKRIFQTIAIFLMPLQLIAQSPLKQGVIEYQQVLKMPKSVAQKNPVLAAITADGVQVLTTVTFQNDKFVITDGSKAQMGEIEMDLLQERELIDLKTKTLRTEATIAGTTYYTEAGETKKPLIHYYSGTKNIAGYICNRAFVQIDSDIYMVWYTPKIPFPYSPMELRFAGIKGAVLGFETEGSVCTAVNVRATGFSLQNILPHKEAPKVTTAQMEAMQQEQMKTLSGKYRAFEIK